MQVLHQLPLLQVGGEELQAADHLLPVRQEQVGHGHVHVARLQSQTCDQRAKLEDLRRPAWLGPLIAEHLLAHGLQPLQHKVPFVFGRVEHLHNRIDFVVYIVVELFVELELDLGVQVLEILVLRVPHLLVDATNRIHAQEVGLAHVDLGLVLELHAVDEDVGQLLRVRAVDGADVEVANLVDVVEVRLVDLADLA